MMYLVVVSDLHLDAVTMGVPRFAEVRRALSQAASLAIELTTRPGRPEVVFACLGDVCDPDSGAGVFRCIGAVLGTAMVLSDAGVESHWLAGNHDVVEDGTGLTTLSPLATLCLDGVGRRIFVHEGPRCLTVPSGFFQPQVQSTVNLITLPFTASSHPYDPAEALLRHLDPARTNLVIGHLAVPGVEPGEETDELARGREVVFPLDALAEARTRANVIAFNGHYHRQQVAHTPAGPIVIPGSLARLTASAEAHTPGCVVMEVE